MASHPQNQRAPSPAPTQQDMDELLAFLPMFSQQGYDPLVSTANNVGCYPQYNPDVGRFFTAAGGHRWTDYNYVPSAMKNAYDDDSFIATANLEQIKSLITYCVRAERFCDGAWKSMIASGRLQCILERLRAIRGESPAT